MIADAIPKVATTLLSRRVCPVAVELLKWSRGVVRKLYRFIVPPDVPSIAGLSGLIHLLPLSSP
jgi:hypothetical protein